MRPLDRPLVVLSVGAMALWAGLTDAILRFLRPSMRPWLVLSGLVLVALGVIGLFVVRRAARQSVHALHSSVDAGGAGWSGVELEDSDHGHGRGHVHEAGPDHGAEHRHGSRVGWMLLLPALVAVLIDPGALGAYAVSRQSGMRLVTAGSFDLEEHLRTHTFGGQTPTLRLSQFLVAARNPEEQELLASTSVRLTGFVVHEPGGPPGSFLLARLQIGCCAGDAVAAIVDVRGYDGEPLEQETWIEVTGTFDREVTNAETEAAEWFVAPIVNVESLRMVDEPREPYEYP